MGATSFDIGLFRLRYCPRGIFLADDLACFCTAVLFAENFSDGILKLRETLYLPLQKQPCRRFATARKLNQKSLQDNAYCK